MNAFTSDLIDQGATFEELGQSINFLLATEIFEIFLEIMGTRSPCGAFFIDFVESAQFQKKLIFFPCILYLTCRTRLDTI